MDDYSRRDFIRTTLPGFLGLSMALPSITAMATRAMACEGRVAAEAPIHWDAFLEAVAKEAARQHLDDWDEPGYVARAAAIARRLDLQDAGLARAFERAKKGIGNGRIDFDTLEKVEDYQISFLQFEKGEQISHHDHPGMTGVLLCATGTVRVWNYDELDERPQPGHVLLRQTGDSRLRKGHVSTLTSKDRNIHRLRADELTQLIDIFAPPYNRERSEKSRWFEVDAEPWQGKAGDFLAKEST
jgi:cysteamine dioxygenase